MQPADLSGMRLVDLSHPWGVHTPAFASYDGPIVKWIKRPAFDRVGGQSIETTLHVGTHLDAPIHFITGGKDVASLDLNERLFGPAVVVDLEALGIGDYDLYGPEHFEEWERRHGIRIEPDDILIIRTGYHRYYNHGTEPAFCRVVAFVNA